MRLALTAAAAFLPVLTSARADDSTYLQYVRGQDPADGGSFNRTQNGTPANALSDSSTGSVTSGSAAVSLTSTSLDLTANAAPGNAGLLRADANTAQTLNVSLLQDSPANSGYTLSVDYQLRGSSSISNHNYPGYAYLTMTTQVGSTATTYNGGFSYGGFDNPLTPGTLNFRGSVPGLSAASATGVNLFTQVEGEVNGRYAQNLHAHVDAVLTLGAVRVLDGNGASIGFRLSATGFAAAAQPVASGASLAGFSLANLAGNGQLGSTVSVLDGTAGADRVLNATFTAAPTAGAGIVAFSDAANFSGTANDGSAVGDLFVIQFTLNETAVLAAGMTDLSAAVLWQDPADGQYKLAHLGDSDGGAAHQAYVGAYQGGVEFALGNYGVDPLNHTVWAVIDHNSVFAAGVAVPEPGTTFLLALGGLGVALGAARSRDGLILRTVILSGVQRSRRTLLTCLGRGQGERHGPFLRS